MIPRGVENIKLRYIFCDAHHFDTQIFVQNAQPRNLGVDDFALVAAKHVPKMADSDLGTQR